MPIKYLDDTQQTPKRKIRFLDEDTVNQSRIEQSFDDSRDIFVNEAMLFPFSSLKRRNGEPVPEVGKGLSFDSSQGILGAAIRGITLPNDVIEGKTKVFNQSGQISDEVIGRSFEAAGIGAPASVASKAISQRAIPAQYKNAEPDVLKRVSDADRFGVELSQGQALRTQPIQAAEQDILANVQGDAAQSILQKQRDEQFNQVGEALTGLKDELAPGTTQTVGEGGELIRDGVIAKARRIKQQSQEAFGKVDNSDAKIKAEALPKLEQKVLSRLESFGANEGTEIAPDLPRVKRMFDKVKRLSTLENFQFGNVTGVKWRELQNVRSQLAKNSKGIDTESAAIGEMRKGLDEFVDDVVMKGLVTGDQSAINELKKARGLWKSYKGILNNPNAAIRKIAEGSLDGSQVANLIVGASQVGNKQAGAGIVRELKKVLGNNAEQINELKRGVLTRLFEDTAKGENKTYGKLASDIFKFTAKDSPELAKELFGDEGLKALRQMAGVLRTLTPDELATNPSRSGQTVLRKVSNVIRGNAALLGFAAGDFTGLLGGLGLKTLNDRRAVGAARRLATTPRPELLKKGRTVGSPLNRLAVPAATLALPKE